MNKEEKLFTGQVVTRIAFHKEKVICPKCTKETGVRTDAYFDSHHDKIAWPKGVYVHKDCLSDKRKDELFKNDPSSFSAVI